MSADVAINGTLLCNAPPIVMLEAIINDSIRIPASCSCLEAMIEIDKIQIN